MQIIASSGGHQDQAMATEKPGYRYDKQGRPLISARRSATSSSKTVTRVDTSLRSPISSPTPSPDTHRVQATSPTKPERGLTEASAYAKSVSTHLGRPDPVPFRAKSAEIPSAANGTSPSGRPLPRPPNAVSDPADVPRRSSSGPKTSLPAAKRLFPHEGGAALVGHSSVAGTDQSQGMQFDFPRSPTIPSLIDPRQNVHLKSRAGSDNERILAATIQTSDPSHVTTSPSLATQRARQRGVNGMELRRPRGRLSLQHLLGHATIQAALLSAISINAFLSLTGSTELLRHQFTGESVGRWVLKEWGVQIPAHFGARWPNLTVWEGFRERSQLSR